MTTAALLVVASLNVTAPAPAPAPVPGVTASQRPVLARQPVRPDTPGIFSVRLENDIIGGTDQGYSSGAALSLSRRGSGLLGRVWDWLGADEGERFSSYELGQLIVTPNDTRRAIPDPTDRPYVGMLYVAASTQRVRDNRLDGIKLVAGVVGPASLAEQVQRVVHEISSSGQAEGWAYQLKNEPILNLVYEHRRRVALIESPGAWGIDAVPGAGAMLGNVLVQGQADGELRFGYNLPRNFGTSTIRGLGSLPSPVSQAGGGASPPFGIYAFAGAGATLVARNLAFDGNTFGDGPRVDKIPAFATGEAGVSFWTRSFEATLSFVWWGREYDAQPRASRFGSATIAWRF